MRPLELRLRNFRSYTGAEHVFDFRDRRLVGIVGPIGSGKSSILDAIAYALYGRTPAVARSTKALINQRSDEGAVSLRFEVDGTIWEAVRSLRRSGASQHALYRLAADEPDAEITDRILQESEVNGHVATLLGLEFDAFSRSVLLAQGRFAEFLTSPPAERDKVLKGLFGYERIDLMRETARAHARSAEIEVEKLAVRLEQIEEAERELIDQREAHRDVEARRDRLEEAAEGVAELDREAAALAGEAERLERRSGELEVLAHRMPDAKASDALLEQASSAADTRRRLAEALGTAEAESRRLASELAVLEQSAGRDLIERASVAIAEWKAASELARAAGSQASEAVKRLTAAEEAAAAAIAAQEQAVRDREAAQDELGAARERQLSAAAALHEAQHRDMAGQLRRDLEPGEPCPVCEHPVAVVPDHLPDAALTAAEEALEAEAKRLAAAEASAARTAAEAAAGASTAAAAQKTRDEAAREMEALARHAAEADATAESARATVEELVGAGDPATLLDGLRSRYTAAVNAAAAAAKQTESARTDHDEAIARAQRTDVLLGDLRMQLVDAAARLEAEIVVGDGIESLRQALGAVRSAWSEERKKVTAAVAEQTERLEAVESKRSELMAGLGVEGAFGDALAAARERVSLLEQAMAKTRERIAAGEAAKTSIAAEQERRDTFGRLASDLTDARFVRYLLDEERAQLAALGSDHFQRLSSGRYRFTEDGVFDIVDLTAADAERKPDSLSGGETFLASLALAIALAEMVARTGGRLDAFFLDEGFGSLDPEHLDLAMEGIEALVSGDGSRLVVVVSHVPEMRLRIDDLIVLDRDPALGDTRVIRS